MTLVYGMLLVPHSVFPHPNSIASGVEGLQTFPANNPRELIGARRKHSCTGAGGNIDVAFLGSPKIPLSHASAVETPW